jgi:hypothetical protein
MSIVDPIVLLWFLPLAVLTILAHCLNAPRELVRVRSLFLWQTIDAAPRAKVTFRPPRLSWLLLLQLLCAALFSIAASNPEAALKGGVRPVVVIVIDNSAASAAVRGTGTCLDTMKKRAVDIAKDALSHGALISVVEVSPPTVLLNKDLVEPIVAAAVDNVHSEFLVPDVARSLLLAKGAQAGSENARIDVVTPACWPSQTVSALKPADLPRRVIFDEVSPSPSANVAITTLSATPTESGLYKVNVGVARFGASGPVAARATVTLNGSRVLFAEPIDQRGESVFQVSSPPGRLTAVVSAGGDDCLRDDDRALLDLPQRTDTRVLYEGAGDAALVKALTGIPGVRLYKPAQGVASAQSIEAQYDIVVRDNVSGGDVPHAPTICFGQYGPAAEDVGYDRHSLSVVDWRRSDPVTRFAGFENVDLGSGYMIPLLSGCHAVIDGTDGTIAESGSEGRQPVAWFGFVPSHGNIAGSLAFPILVLNAVRTMQAQTAVRAVGCGAVAYAAPWPANDVTVTGPDGRKRVVTPYGGVDDCGYIPDQPGTYTVVSPSGRSTVAVGVLNRDLSDTQPIDVGYLQRSGAVSAPRVDVSDIWPAIVAFAAVLMVLSWLVPSRRPTPASARVNTEVN